MKLPLATGFLPPAPAAVGGAPESGRFRVREDRRLDATADAAPPKPTLLLELDAPLEDDAVVPAEQALPVPVTPVSL
jgi:hypothetical protein